MRTQKARCRGPTRARLTKGPLWSPMETVGVTSGIASSVPVADIWRTSPNHRGRTPRNHRVWMTARALSRHSPRFQVNIDPLPHLDQNRSGGGSAAVDGAILHHDSRTPWLNGNMPQSVP